MNGFDLSSLLFVLYIGPDQVLPLQSALAAIVGLLLLFWRRLLGAVFRLWRLFQARLNK